MFSFLCLFKSTFYWVRYVRLSFTTVRFRSTVLCYLLLTFRYSSPSFSTVYYPSPSFAIALDHSPPFIIRPKLQRALISLSLKIYLTQSIGSLKFKMVASAAKFINPTKKCSSSALICIMHIPLFSLTFRFPDLAFVFRENKAAIFLSRPLDRQEHSRTKTFALSRIEHQVR